MALPTALLAASALLPLSAAAETVLGIYVFHRHGDRTSKEWPPTMLTPLGADQVFSSATYFRNRYVAANATHRITAVAPDVAVLSQLSVTAPVDNVLQNSAGVFVQGLYPPAGTAAAQTLANGTTVEAPFGGYQYIPVNAVSGAASAGGSEDSEWLQGGSGCGNAVVSSNNYFSSADYLATLSSTQAFYQGLVPVINTTFSAAQASFKNAYTIYDYVHVSEIHNATIPSSSLLTPETLFQLQTRADQHEWGLAYNASEPVRAIAGAVLAAQILQSLNTTLLAPPGRASATRMGIQFGAYAAFMSFFGLAGLPAASPDFMGIVDYASAAVFELVTNATLNPTSPVDPAQVSVRFFFSNGTAANQPGGLREFPLFGQAQSPLPWTDFASQMGKFAVGDTADWCKACGNTTGVCASASSSSSSSSSSPSPSASGTGGGGGGVSRPVAGVIGALVTLVVILGFEALVMGLAGLRVVKKSVAAAGKTAVVAGGGADAIPVAEAK